jgi:hypothetical protein
MDAINLIKFIEDIDSLHVVEDQVTQTHVAAP